MKKTMKTALLICLTLLACALMLTACDSGNEPQTPDGTTDSHIHTFGEWTVTTAPTCDQEGVQTRTCACGEKEEQSVAPQHQMVAEAYDVEPTCVTAGGKATEKCSVCGYRNIEITAKPLGHSLSEKNNGHLCCDTCDVASERIYEGYGYSWYCFYVVYGSYETWEDNMSPELSMYEYYDVLVPRHDYIISILPTLFKGSRLKAITMTDNIVSIEKSAFEECTELTYVKLPSTIQKIDSRAFAGCVALIHIQYDGTMEQWNAIEKGTDWDAGTGSYTVICSDGNITKS